MRWLSGNCNGRHSSWEMFDSDISDILNTTLTEPDILTRPEKKGFQTGYQTHTILWEGWWWWYQKIVVPFRNIHYFGSFVCPARTGLWAVISQHIRQNGKSSFRDIKKLSVYHSCLVHAGLESVDISCNFSLCQSSSCPFFSVWSLVRLRHFLCPHLFSLVKSANVALTSIYSLDHHGTPSRIYLLLTLHLSVPHL